MTHISKKKYFLKRDFYCFCAFKKILIRTQCNIVEHLWGEQQCGRTAANSRRARAVPSRAVCTARQTARAK